MFGNSKYIHYIYYVIMRDMRNIIYILGAIGVIVIGIGTMTGQVQNHIKFQDPLNEMVFCLMCLLMGVATLMNVNFKKK